MGNKIWLCLIFRNIWQPKARLPKLSLTEWRDQSEKYYGTYVSVVASPLCQVLMCLEQQLPLEPLNCERQHWCGWGDTSLITAVLTSQCPSCQILPKSGLIMKIMFFLFFFCLHLFFHVTDSFLALCFFLCLILIWQSFQHRLPIATLTLPFS